jgi:hypothetical protein
MEGLARRNGRFANQGAKRLDFRPHEICECSHPRGLLHVAMHEQVVGGRQVDIVDNTHEVRLVITLKGEQRSEPRSGFDGQHKPRPIVTASSDCGMRRHRLQPTRSGIVRNGIATADNDVAINILRAYRAAMTLQVAMTRIDRPRCVRDLAPNQRLVAWFAGAYCNIGLAFGQIKKPVADHELDLQAGMARVKIVYEIRSPQAIRQD